MPPLTHTATGEARRVGVELEMAGIDIERLAAHVVDHVGGQLEQISPYEYLVHGDPAGDWQVELDSRILKEKGRTPRDPDSPLAPLDEATEALIRFGAEQILPLEVVSPPLPMPRLGEVDRLVEGLRQAGAQGTTSGLINAFGMQLDPELPALDAGTIRRYLQAFLCLYDWLERRARVDLARRLSPFVQPFPGAYVRKVVDPGYHPDLAGLMDDYLAASPTRNRPLDMLPLFLELDPDRVRGVVHDRKVKARPTLHYRLPNSEIDRPGWGIRDGWQDWLQVEHLAAQPDRLADLCAAYSAHLDRPLSGILEDWVTMVEQWLIEPSAL